ncbi:phage tail protein [Salmonella enterica]|uniref:phage tail protein n=1 Tax=Salmonella enterica TaxID=28901 RepID=UPI0020CFA334|nr:phage tail protein [Salmonella enterica]
MTTSNGDNQEIMMGIGESFIFSISTVAYSQLQRSDEWRWAEQTRFGQNDALQLTGRPNPEITVTGKIHALFMDGCGIGQLDKLRSLGNAGDPQQMVMGTGEVMGYWVIKALNDNQTKFLTGGAPKSQDFTLKLTYYGESLG